MDWQEMTALALVALTALCFLRVLLRRHRSKLAAGGGCGCSSSGPSPQRNSVVYTARKGERPQVTVKGR